MCTSVPVYLSTYLSMEPRTLKRLLLAAIALYIAWLAQGKLTGPLRSDGWILYGIAIVLFVLAFARVPVAQFARGQVAAPSPITRQSGWREGLLWALLGLSALSTVISLIQFSTAGNNPSAWLLHIASVLLFISAFIPVKYQNPNSSSPTPQSGARAARVGDILPISNLPISNLQPPTTHLRHALPFLAVIALAVFARLWQIDQFPFGTWYDEADNGNYAVQILNDPNYRPVYVESTNLPAHFLYLIALSFKLFGVGTISIRLVTVAFGIVTVIFAYLLFRRWFGERMGLVAAAMFAVLRYDLTFSRIALHGVTTPAFEVIVLYFLDRALERKQLSDFAAMGLALGFGLAFYASFRLFPIVLGIFIVGLVIAALVRGVRSLSFIPSGRGRFSLLQWVPHLAIFVLGTLIAIAPVAQFAWQNRDVFFARTNTVSIFERRDERDLSKALISNTLKHLEMFNVLGDRNGRHNLPNEPMLDPIIGALAVLGCGYALWRWRDPANALMLLTFLIMNLGGILSVDFEAPQSLRSVGVMPSLVYFATVPLVAIGLEIARVFRLRLRPSDGRATLPAVTSTEIAQPTIAAFPAPAVPAAPPRAMSQLEMRMGAARRTSRAAPQPKPASPIKEPTVAPRTLSQLEMRMGAARRRPTQLTKETTPNSQSPISNLQSPISNLLISNLQLPTTQPPHPRTRKAGRAKPASGAYHPTTQLSFYSLALIALLTAITYFNFNTFFNKQKNSSDAWAAHSAAETIVGNELNRLAPNYDLIVSSLYANHPTVRFIAPNVTNYQQWTVNDRLPLTRDTSRGVALLLDPLLVSSYHEARRNYPTATYREFKPPAGTTPALYEAQLSPNDLRAVQGVVARYFKGESFDGAPIKEEAVAQINLDWTKTQPVNEKFSAELRGTLYVSQYGPYRFSVRGLPTATLLIDENLVNDAAVTLAKGNHALRLRTPGVSAKVEVLWQVPGASQPQPIPASVLFRPPVTNSGLLGTYYQSPNWSGNPAFTQIDPEIALYFHNIPLPRPYSIEWKGKLYAPTAGTYRFATESIDNSQLLINNQIVVDNQRPGSTLEGAASLTQGWNDIVVRFADKTSHTHIYLYWIPPGSSRETVPSRYLSPPMGQYPTAAEIAALPVPLPLPNQPIPQQPAQPSLPLSPAEVAPLNLAYVQTIGQEGTGQLQFKEPRAVAIGVNGTILVADTGNKRVQMLDADGKFIGAIDGGDEKFVEPFDLVTTSIGDIIVLDSEQGWLYRFDPNGKPIGRFGGPSAQFFHPRGLSIDPSDHLYVADTGGSRIVKLSLTGERLQVFGTKGTGKGQFIEPSDGAVDYDGFLYATDVPNRRIQLFSADGRFMLEFQIPAAGAFNGPHIAFAPDQTLLVTAPEPHKIQRYSRDGKLVGEWGGFGQQPNQFRLPTGITVDGNFVWIADTGNHRIQKWKLETGS